MVFPADSASSWSVNDFSFGFVPSALHTMTGRGPAEIARRSAGRPAIRHDDAVRRSLRVVAGALGVIGMLGLSTAAVASPAPSVRTVAGSRGSGNLSAPSGIALDTAGDLFIADTNRCRVVLVPSRSGTLYGLRVRAGQATSLAGGSCGGTHSLGYPTGVAVDHRGDVFVAEASAQRVQM